MPRSKRAPIDYAPQFGGIFRPKEAVEHELAELDRGSDEETIAGSPPLLAHVTTIEPETDRAGSTLSRSSPSPIARTNERTNERMKTRHSFDVWHDQLLALTEIQVARFNRTGRKPKMGELVQEALDAYIAKQLERTNVRTNDRSYDRSQR
jgi:hypothetical protein